MTYPFTGTIEGEVTADLQGPPGPEGPPGPQGEPGGGGVLVDGGIRYVAQGGSNSNDGLSWATAMATPSAAGLDVGHGRVIIGNGTFLDAGIRLKEGLVYEGLTPLASTVQLANGANGPLFVSDPGIAAGSWLHQSGIRHLRLHGNKANNTSGNIVEFNCRVGENTMLDDLLIVAGADNGIRTNRGGQPIYWRDLHIFGCDGYGVSLSRTGGDIFHTVLLEMISGDNNTDGLIHVQGAADRTKENFTFVGVKAEVTTAGRQENVIVLEATQCSVTVIGGGTVEAGAAGNSFVKVIAPAPTSSHLTLMGIATNHTYWVDDVPRGVKVAKLGIYEEMMLLTYARGQTYLRLTGENLYPMLNGLNLIDGVPAPAPLAGHAAIYVDAADGDLKVKFSNGIVKTISVDT